MDRLSNVGKIIIVGVIAAGLIVLVVIYGTSTSQPQTSTGVSDTMATDNGVVTAASPTQTTDTVHETTPTPPQKQNVPSSAPKKISIITPVASDIWKIGTDNLISWNQPGDISGDIYLVDATTGVFAGVILPQVGPEQTSYTWNTRDLLVDRTSPFKKDVVPGTYVLKIAYDGNNVAIATSPSFTITN